jgi:hypothetical protein
VSCSYLNLCITGNACFVCETAEDLGDISNTQTFDCTRCSPLVTLDLTQGPRVLEHIGAHILYDAVVLRSQPLCGLCLRPPPICEFFIGKGKGAHGRPRIDEKKSRGCLVKITYSYGVASESTATSPCSNVPIQCPRCSEREPAIWRYFLKAHFEERHPKYLNQDKHLWAITKFEMLEMKKIWNKRQKVTVRRTKRSDLPPLVISEDHRARIPAR